MVVAIACDHGGFALKARIIQEIQRSGAQALDLGAHSEQPLDDYPDYAIALGAAIASGRAGEGILICGSGVGASVAANKLPGIRAALCHDTFSAHQGREDDNCNVLCMGARIIGPELAAEVARVWLGAKFSGAERHRRRVAKVMALEKGWGRNGEGLVKE